jgi:hypothetical protein
MTPMGTKRVVAVDLSIGLAIAWLVGVARRPAQFWFTEDGFWEMQATGLSISVGVVAGIVVVGAVRRGASGATAVAIGAVGVTGVVAGGRLLDLGRIAESIAAAAWLGGGAAVLAAIAVSGTVRDEPPGLVARACIAAVAATGIAAGALGVGPHLDHVEPAPVLARVVVAAQVVALGVAFVAVVGVRHRSGRWRRNPMLLTAVVWLGVALAERVLHVLPLTSYWSLEREAYRQGAVVVAMFAPVLTTVAVVVALGWLLAIRPHAERLPSGVLVVPDRDPVAALRDDLAAWTGDPTIELVFSDGSGSWLGRVEGAVERVASYDRAATTVTRSGRPVALLDHDISLADAPAALRTAAELAGVAFDANQLMALSEARVVEARHLGERLLVADATTREQLLAELEAGPIAVLERCIDAVDFGAPLDEVAESLREVTAGVRTLSHGLHPPDLVDHGLAAVLVGHPGTPSRRLPAAVEITAYLLAAEDPLSTLEDDGTILWVHRTTPITDRALIDRIEILGGSVQGTSTSIPVGDH